MLKFVTIENYNISKFDLSSMNWKEIPEKTFELKNLRKLNLSNNRLKGIPKEISKLKNLENIDLSNNLITSLYAKLFDLRKLKTLILNKNSISTIPKQIIVLKNLRILGLAHNNLKKLNDNFEHLINLKELNIAHNEFIKFPEVIYKLKNLKSLWCAGNKFKDFSAKTISESMPGLEKIYCYNPLLKEDECSTDYFELSKIKGNSIKKLIELSKIKSLVKTVKKEHVKEENNMAKSKIFISYARDDSEWLKKVQTHLKVLKFSNDKFDVWDDTMIKAGEKWKVEIENALNEAKIAILLISTNFLASDFIRDNELPPLLKSAEKNGTIIMPLIIKHSRFTKEKNLSVFQAVNDPNNPLDNKTNSQVDKILVKLTEDIENYL